MAVLEEDEGQRQLIFLGSAVVAAILAGLFVMAYNALMIAVQLPCDFSADRLEILPAWTRFCVAADLVWYLVPVASLALGLRFLRRGQSTTRLAAVVAVTWLLSLAWILLALVSWLLPLVPLCGPVRQ